MQAPTLEVHKNSGDAVTRALAAEQEAQDTQLKIQNGTSSKSGGGRRKSRRRRRRSRKRSRRRSRRSRRRYRKRGGGKAAVTQCNGPGCNMNNVVKGQELLMKIGTQAEYDKISQNGGRRRIRRRRGYRNRTRRRGKCPACLSRRL